MDRTDNGKSRHPGRSGGGRERDRRGPHRIAALLQLLALCASVAVPAAAQCTSVKPLTTQRGGFVGGIADTIGLILEDPALGPVAEEAVRSWSRCRNYGTGFPAFRVGERGTRTIKVRYVRGSDGMSRTCGVFRGGTITLYATTVGPRGRRLPCGALEDNLAHELGHVLGLKDCPDLRSCDFHVMAYIDLGINRKGRVVQPEECQLVGQRWLTSVEHRRANESRAAEANRLTSASLPRQEEERPR
jgi:hypothetical protein